MNDHPVAEAAETGAKVDPETLVLRGRPGRVVRFRRGLIVAIAGSGSVALVGAAWLAFRPPTLSQVIADDDRPALGSNAVPDALAGAPKSYGDVPRLGPPLPGDLGRPILEQQRELASAASTDHRFPHDRTDAIAEAAEAERQRRLAEARQAREAPVMMRLSNAATASAGNESSSAAEPRSERLADAASSVPDPGQAHKLSFASERDLDEPINSHRLTKPASRWQINAGSVIAASLMTGLNSDLPGLVVAQVTEHAYDSATGQTILIPQGARLIGRYDSFVAFGQSRALLIWQRIVFPDGSSIQLDNLPATDAAGYSGIADRVDFHTWRLLRGIGLATLLGVGTQLTFGNREADLVRALRESAQSNADRAGQRIVERNLDIQPTIRVRPGVPLRVLVHKDLVLEPWKG